MKSFTYYTTKTLFTCLFCRKIIYKLCRNILLYNKKNTYKKTLTKKRLTNNWRGQQTMTNERKDSLLHLNNEGEDRQELHKTIWAIADDLRGAVDGWDFKSYILSTMFYRFISENLTNYINKDEIEAGDENFDYAKISDEMAEEIREEIIDEKGFFILPSQLFCNVRKKAPYDENLNETLERIFHDIESSAKGSMSESNFKGLFDDFDVNSNKLGSTVAKRNEKLVKLLEGIGSMKFGEYKNNAIDAFGDAYEYLMAMYASNAGKSGGEYYTPQSVSELLTRLAIGNKRDVKNVYDPACGSGGLLLKAIKVLGKNNVTNGFYGQEKNLTTYNLCRINMFLHDINFDQFHIACEDTLITPYFRENEGSFEVIVSNPPYSVKWAGSDNVLLINDERFAPAGVLAPKSKADLAFVMHSCSYLSDNGVAAIVCFPGIMYRAGAEGKIRGYLVDSNFVDCVIQLPENLFFGTSIGTCIMVLKKNKVDRKILFIDASNECVKVTNNNILSSENIANIVNVYQNRIEKENFSKLVDYETVRDLDYNLSVSTYVESKGEEEKFDIDSLNVEIKQIVARQQELRLAIDKIIEEMQKTA